MTPVRVLLVEDSPEDAARVVDELRVGGFDPTWRRVDDGDALCRALESEPWDVVLCDSALERLDAPQALEVVRRCRAGVPFIVLSSSTEEAATVRAMRAGADEYVPKNGEAWLAAAVARELRDARIREERARALEDLRKERIEEERTRLMAKLEEAIRARDDFLAIASHELKTPLTSLQLQVQTLLRMVDPDAGDEVRRDRLVHKLSVVTRQVERLNKLVTELLDISHIARGRLDLEAEEVDLSEVVDKVVARLDDAAADAGSSMVVDAEPHVRGRWDRFRVEQVVTNLVANAIKYGQGNPVRITVRQKDGAALLSVEDHGIGIAPADQARIFKRFERAVSEASYGGFGMGLWIVRQIVEAQGGTIRVQSQRGRGSTFTVEMPLSGAEDERERAGASLEASAGAGR